MVLKITKYGSEMYICTYINFKLSRIKIILLSAATKWIYGVGNSDGALAGPYSNSS